MAEKRRGQPDVAETPLEPAPRQPVSEQELRLREQDRAEFEEMGRRKAPPGQGSREAELRELQLALVRNSATGAG
jgi:hypothetical protein